MLNSSRFGLPFLSTKTLSRGTVCKRLLFLTNLLLLIEIDLGVSKVIFMMVSLISIAKLDIASIALEEGHSATALRSGSLDVIYARLLLQMLLQCCR